MRAAAPLQVKLGGGERRERPLHTLGLQHPRMWLGWCRKLLAWKANLGGQRQGWREEKNRQEIRKRDQGRLESLRKNERQRLRVSCLLGFAFIIWGSCVQRGELKLDYSKHLY